MTCRIQIYSPETGRWRVCEAPFVKPPYLDFSGGVYWNGAMHWVNGKGGASIYFDLSKGLDREMPMPPPLPPQVCDDAMIMTYPGGV